MVINKFKLYLFLGALLVISACPNKEETPQNQTFMRISNFESGYVQARNIDIYLPPDYHESDKTYPTLYMHDGQMLFDPNNCWNGQAWEVDSVAQQLITQKLVQPFIIIGIWNNENRYAEYCPEAPLNLMPESDKEKILTIIKGPTQSDNYLNFITKELIPYINQNLKTKTEPSNTAIMGSSMGGLISAYALCQYPEVFGSAACLSTHWVGPSRSDAFATAMIEYLAAELPDLRQNKLYFDHGTATLDTLYEPYQIEMDKTLTAFEYEQGKDWVTRKFEGADHSEVAWRERVHVPLTYLYGL